MLGGMFFTGIHHLPALEPPHLPTTADFRRDTRIGIAFVILQKLSGPMRSKSDKTIRYLISFFSKPLASPLSIWPLPIICWALILFALGALNSAPRWSDTGCLWSLLSAMWSPSWLLPQSYQNYLYKKLGFPSLFFISLTNDKVAFLKRDL